MSIDNAKQKNKICSQHTFYSEKPKQRELAIQSWHAASEAGNADALAELAFAYLSGYGIEKNPTKAAQLMQQAAEKGCMSAQFYLASVTYDTCNASKEEYKKAREYFRMAAEQGHAESAFRYALYGHFWNADISKYKSDFDDFIECFKSIPFGDDVEVSYDDIKEDLFYREEMWAEWLKRTDQEDHETVAKLLHNAAEQGHLNAQYLLYHLYHVGKWPYKKIMGGEKSRWDMDDMWFFIASKGGDDHMFSTNRLSKLKVDILSQDDAVIERAQKKAETKYAQIEKHKKQQKNNLIQFAGPFTQLIANAKPSENIVTLTEELIEPIEQMDEEEELQEEVLDFGGIFKWMAIGLGFILFVLALVSSDS